MSRSSKIRGNDNGDMKPLEGKATHVGHKRRALGDITNATTMEEGKENIKKVATFPMVSTVVASVESNEMMVDESVPTFDDRPYMLRPSDDIDSRDALNPLLVSSYVNNMYEHFSAAEKQFVINSFYMTSQPYINDKMRCILVDWLVSEYQEFVEKYTNAKYNICRWKCI